MAKLIIIEDDPLMSRMYQKALDLFHHDVTLATDGIIGLELISKTRFDAILLDVMMPKMNGLDVLKRLKEDNKTKDIPVIILTNSVSDKVIDAAMKMGAKKYIIKSDYDPEQVVKMIDEIVNKDNQAEVSIKSKKPATSAETTPTKAD